RKSNLLLHFYDIPSHLAKAGGFVLSSRLPFSLFAHERIQREPKFCLTSSYSLVYFISYETPFGSGSLLPLFYLRQAFPLCHPKPTKSRPLESSIYELLFL